MLQRSSPQTVIKPQRTYFCHEIIHTLNTGNQATIRCSDTRRNLSVNVTTPVWKTVRWVNSAITTRLRYLIVSIFFLMISLCKNQPLGESRGGGDYTHFSSHSGQEKPLFLRCTASWCEWLKQPLIACKHFLISSLRRSPVDSQVMMAMGNTQSKLAFIGCC